MQYQEFRIRVENMNENEANSLLDAIILQVEAKGLRMGGGFHPLSDADLEMWAQVKGHVRAIWSEIKAWVNSQADRVTEWLSLTLPALLGRGEEDGGEE